MNDLANWTKKQAKTDIGKVIMAVAIGAAIIIGMVILYNMFVNKPELAANLTSNLTNMTNLTSNVSQLT